MVIDPRRIPFEEREAKIEATCAYHGIDRNEHYTEKQALFLLLSPARRQPYLDTDKEIDRSTFRRARARGHVPHIEWASGSVRFKGEQLADYLNYGKHAVLLWGAADIASENSDLESGTLPPEEKVPPSTGRGPTQKPDAQSVFRLAQQAGKTQKSG